MSDTSVVARTVDMVLGSQIGPRLSQHHLKSIDNISMSQLPSSVFNYFLVSPLPLGVLATSQCGICLSVSKLPLSVTSASQCDNYLSV